MLMDMARAARHPRREAGLPSGAAQESMARLRAALAHVGLRPPTQSLTLHVHPTCTKEDVKAAVEVTWMTREGW